MTSDRQIERLRYEQQARKALSLKNGAAGERPSGAAGIAPIHRAPYVCYEREIGRVIRSGSRVLELGAGMGMHTSALADTDARVVATDISETSLRLLSHRVHGSVTTVVADMEALPFAAESFDVVASAGSLSYGEPSSVDEEIMRVLRPGGTFVCVDSLNHNPVYRFNRWVRMLRGHRTASTLRRMPDQRRIDGITQGFESVSVYYFGAATMFMPLAAGVIGQETAARLSDSVDRTLGTRWSAFKFVLVAEGRR